MPLARLLYVNKMTPRLYVGVDANDFQIPEMLKGKKIVLKVWTETDLCTLEKHEVGLSEEVSECSQGNKTFDLHLPNTLVCFEVLEHVTPEHCRRMLQHFLELTSEDCNYFISTPCYNGSAAGNHINEMTYSALGGLLEDLSYHVVGVWGTFASISDYQNLLDNVVTFDWQTGKINSSTNLVPIFNALRNYYDTNVLATIFAPLFPDKARNCLWHLTRKVGDAVKQERLFSSLGTMPTPWSQHPNWRDLAG